MPKTLITKNAWQIITREVEYFAYHSGSSKEAIVYPLFGFITKNTKPIRETITLEDIEYFVITHAFAPPRELCNHQGVRAGFMFNNDEEKNKITELVESWSRQYTDIYPTLEVGHVHSHQFATGTTYPSSGRWGDYYRIHKLWQHLFHNRNLNTVLEVIICKKEIKKSWFSFLNIFSQRKPEWNPCCFAFNNQQGIVNIGMAEIVSDNDKRIREVLTIPFYQTNEGKMWEARQYQEFKEIMIKNSYWGWRIYKIQYAENQSIFIYFPPSFPDTHKLFYETYDSVTKEISKFHEWNINKSIMNFNLSEIISFLPKDK